MNARCTVCNSSIEFNASKGRAKQLKDRRCECKGKYEPMFYVRADEDSVRAQPVHRNYNNIEYRWDIKNNLYILIIPTATP